MLAQLKKNLFDSQTKKLKKYEKTVDKINKLESSIQALSDEALKNKTKEFKQELEKGKEIEDILEEAFAVVREVSKRITGLRHYDVQLMGGIALTEGNISEMATGEGKTLVESLPSYLRALEGKGVHIITVNEYLAKRDKEIIGPIFEYLGLSVGLNLADMSPAEKRDAYAADITYGIGTEFGFDYLRDHLVTRNEDKVQRPYHYAIIDEVDSILIDEAKTPLIVAAKTGVSKELFYLTARVIKDLVLDVHYSFDPESKSTNLLHEGINLIEKSFAIDNLYDREHQTLYHYMIQSLRARVMFKRDVDYIVSDGKVHLVDAFTGRIMDGRSLSNGLHQAIEAKEGLELTEENKTNASITIQNYFRKYPILSGMTGTAKTEEEEIRMIYNMEVIQIPTNREKIRVDQPDLVYLTKNEKYAAIMKDVEAKHFRGQPILIGTSSIEQSEEMAAFLDEQKLSYQLLNAKNAEKEAQLIALAGQKSQITIATNMAGRGTDIILGEGMRELGGLHVVGTERNESRRIDNQLKGRAGRQGDPGSSRFFISMEDDLMIRFGGEDLEKKIKSLKSNGDGLIRDKNIIETVDRVQRMCEGNNYSAREFTLKLDDTINSQRDVIYDLREAVIAASDLSGHLSQMLHHTLDHFINDHCSMEISPEEWPIQDLKAAFSKIMPLPFEMAEFDDIKDLKLVLTAELDTYIELLTPHFENEAFVNRLQLLMIQVIDQQWMDHLEAMDNLKEGIGLRSYAQLDPMVVFQQEGLDIFKETFHFVERDISEQTAILYLNETQIK